MAPPVVRSPYPLRSQAKETVDMVPGAFSVENSFADGVQELSVPTTALLEEHAALLPSQAVALSPPPSPTGEHSGRTTANPQVKDENEGGPWIQVTYRCGHSRSPPSTPRQEESSGKEARSPLTAEQYHAVESASARLTAEQVELLRRRSEALQGGAFPQGRARSPSPGEGTSWHKGKSIDA
ncbi:hypothetical protein K474DRAFT_617060 [Panus rudis PR-1116 ss-1]|nr:hypothetical protein K474DRAFT_617060 [Panus rudis PR-1116 ss-1]